MNWALFTQTIQWKLSETHLLLHDNSVLQQLSVLSKANCQDSSHELQTLSIVVLLCRPPVFRDNEIACISVLNQWRSLKMHGKLDISTDYYNVFLWKVITTTWQPP